MQRISVVRSRISQRPIRAPFRCPVEIPPDAPVGRSTLTDSSGTLTRPAAAASAGALSAQPSAPSTTGLRMQVCLLGFAFLVTRASAREDVDSGVPFARSLSELHAQGVSALSRHALGSIMPQRFLLSSIGLVKDRSHPSGRITAPVWIGLSK